MDKDEKPLVEKDTDETQVTNESEVEAPESELAVEETSPDNPAETPSETPTPEPASDAPKKAPRFSRKKKLIIAVILFVIVAGGSAFALLGNKKDSSKSSSSAQDKIATVDTVKATPSSDDITVNGNTYYAKPVEIKNLFLFTSEECKDETKGCATVKSFLVGKTKDGNDIIAHTLRDEGQLDIVVIKKGADYEVAVPTDFAKNNIESNNMPNLKSSSSTTLSELAVDSTITIKEQPLKTNGVIKLAFLSYDDKGILQNKPPEKGTKLITKNNIDYYVSEKDKDSYTIKSVNAYFGNLFSFNYSLNGELSKTDSKAAESIKWSKGEQSTSTYYTGGQGCGLDASFVAGKVTKADLSEVGKTPGGQTIYQLANNHPIVTEIYEKDYAKETALDDYKNLTLQQFVDKHSYFLIENGLGDFMVYISDKAAPKGGCGKPVVYLYPQKATAVSVRVGANVTISDPIYPSGGWKNVLAQPNGSLTYQGTQFGSLFWEGQGNGAYPDITNGTVVARSKAIATITDQLKQQGLKGREITEFISFWEPNLPNTPYVRLTWFTAPQINELAPLSITPKPDTTIRVFLDFEGLQKPVSMPAQTFKTPKRNGFTVVEWGGLARNGLQSLVR